MISFEVRNGCRSERLLIEFEAIPIGQFTPLWEKVVPALKAELVSIEDVWQNDEHIRRYNSPIGNFFLTVSNLEIPFVMAEDFEQENGDNSVILGVAEKLVEMGDFENVSEKEI